MKQQAGGIPRRRDERRTDYGRAIVKSNTELSCRLAGEPRARAPDGHLDRARGDRRASTCRAVQRPNRTPRSARRRLPNATNVLPDFPRRTLSSARGPKRTTRLLPRATRSSKDRAHALPGSCWATTGALVLSNCTGLAERPPPGVGLASVADTGDNAISTAPAAVRMRPRGAVASAIAHNRSWAYIIPSRASTCSRWLVPWRFAPAQRRGHR